VQWSLHFVVFGILSKAVTVTSVKSLSHCPVSHMMVSEADLKLFALCGHRTDANAFKVTMNYKPIHPRHWSEFKSQHFWPRVECRYDHGVTFTFVESSRNPKDERKKCINVNVKCVFTFSSNSIRNVSCFDKQLKSNVRETIGRRAKLHLDGRVQCLLFLSNSNRSWKEPTNLITSPRPLYIFIVNAFSRCQVL
jgi:hypothetical protein